MRRFWDERAREDAFFFVDDRLAYRNPDLERFWRGGEEALDALLGACGLALAETDEAVEIGCGLGRMTRAIAGRARSVRALDVSQEMLSRAQELNPMLANISWLHGDGTSLSPIATASADACISHVVFQHVPDPQVTLGYVREIGRVLRPGGWAAFQVSNDPSVHQPRGTRRRLSLRRAPRGREHPAWLGSAIDLDELAATAGDAGMDIEQLSGQGTQFCIVGVRRRS